MNYDSFSDDYDRFVNWNERLAFELPFFTKQLAALQPEAGQAQAGQSRLRVLDSACGTGMHAIALARQGYAACGADLSGGMVARSRANAASAGVDTPFFEAGFGQLAETLTSAALLPCDALLCLGNSLPHILSPEVLQASLRDFAACLRPGGLLVIQNRNFDAVLVHRERWMEPQSAREGDGEWLFLRFYDYRPDGCIDFNIVTLKRTGAGSWKQSITTTALYPLRQAELLPALDAAGFTDLTCYGSLNGAPYDPQSSGNLVVTARRK
jgi:SAM-dependent methyltransferase